jgi:hypothetical protein
MADPIAARINPIFDDHCSMAYLAKESHQVCMMSLGFRIRSLFVGTRTKDDQKFCSGERSERRSRKLSAFKYPYRKQCGILTIIDADAGNRYSLWHLDDREKGIKSHQLPANGNTDDRAIGFRGHDSREGS